MKSFIFLCAGLFLLSGLAACETKVINQPPSTGNPTVIEHDRVIHDNSHPDVNIHVDK